MGSPTTALRRSISRAQMSEETEAREDHPVLQPPDHVHVEIGCDLFGEVLGPRAIGQGLDVVGGAEQPQLLARPGGEDHVAIGFQLSRRVFRRQLLRDLDHGGDARGVVVRAVMNSADFITVGQ